MNLTEGTRRMQVAGRRVNLTGASLLVCFFFLTTVLHTTDPALARLPTVITPVFMFLLPVSLWLVLLGAALWVAGWVLSGFAQPQHHGPSLVHRMGP